MGESFEQLLAGRGAALLEDIKELGGTVRIDLRDDNGSSWYVDLERGVISQEPTEPDLIIRAYLRDFLSFIDGEMSAKDGLKTQRLSLAGDVQRLFRLADLLTEARAKRVSGGAD